MKKKTQLYAILGIAAVMFIVIVCVVPFRKGSIFVISLICELIAFALQIPFFKVAFEDRDSLKSKVLGFPVFRIGLIYLAVQTVLSMLMIILATAVESFPLWVAIILYVIVAGFALICGVSADIARDTVENIEMRTAVDTSFMKELRVRAESLVSANDTYRSELTKLSENIRFSDPVSSTSSKNADHSLDMAMSELERALSDGSGDISALCRNVQNALNERNNIVKLNKRG